MLVLTRRIGQSVIINDDIYCTLIGAQRDEVKLIFETPESVSLRAEDKPRHSFLMSSSNQQIEALVNSKHCRSDRLISCYNRGDGESVIIGEVVCCTVRKINYREVRLVFDAPKAIPINRLEIQQRIWHESEAIQANTTSDNRNVLERVLVRFKGKLAKAA